MFGDPISIPFFCELSKAAEETVNGAPRRKLGGWLTTAKRDLDGERMIAALSKGAIDFEPYLSYGVWNDNHHYMIDGVRFKITIGYPTALEFHKGKGWYTEGYLLDDTDKPGIAVQRANYYWDLAKSLKSMKDVINRSLGFSVEGYKKDEKNGDILKAVVTAAAIAEIPKNPECVIEILKSFYDVGLSEGIKKTPHDVLKALDSSSASPLIQQDLEGYHKGDTKKFSGLNTKEKIEHLLTIIKEKYPHISDLKSKKILKRLIYNLKEGKK